MGQFKILHNHITNLLNNHPILFKFSTPCQIYLTYNAENAKKHSNSISHNTIKIVSIQEWQTDKLHYLEYSFKNNKNYLYSILFYTIKDINNLKVKIILMDLFKDIISKTALKEILKILIFIDLLNLHNLQYQNLINKRIRIIKLTIMIPRVSLLFLKPISMITNR